MSILLSLRKTISNRSAGRLADIRFRNVVARLVGLVLFFLSSSFWLAPGTPHVLGEQNRVGDLHQSNWGVVDPDSVMGTSSSFSPFGLHISLPLRFPSNTNDRARASQLLAQAGTSWIREEFSWFKIEPNPAVVPRVYTEDRLRAYDDSIQLTV